MKKEILQALCASIEVEEKNAKHLEYWTKQGFQFIHSDGITEIYYLESKRRLVEAKAKGNYSKFYNIKFINESGISEAMRTALLSIKYLELKGSKYLEEYV